MGASLFAVNKGFMDDLDVKKVLAVRKHGLHGWLKDQHAALLEKLEANKAMDKEAEAELTAADRSVQEVVRLIGSRLEVDATEGDSWQQARKFAARSNRWRTPRRSPRPWKWWPRFQDAQGAGAHARRPPLQREDPQHRGQPRQGQPGVHPRVHEDERRQGVGHHRGPTDKGLCGGLNTNVLRAVTGKLREAQAAGNVVSRWPSATRAWAS
jgi:hypothetical protein